ncbi:MAG: XRE family transcriptional regulator [Gammaproteobacteria bacterium]|nr:XRE family transcriptional regulator [Gammaproteobacteria bacterium]
MPKFNQPKHSKDTSAHLQRDQGIGIQPEVLRWARTTCGLSVNKVAEMLKTSPSKIEDWESGAGVPTYSQLEKLAYKIYKRPLAMFFLPSPPEEPIPKREFRTLPETDLETLLPDTYFQIRRAHAYQIALRELFDNQNPSGHCIGQSLKLSSSKGVAEQAVAIRNFLGITIEDQVAWKSDEIALKKWRQAIENAGVFVFKDTFKQKDISGFCLMDEYLPIIYVNNSTSKTRQTFSLLHELAHLLIGVNGLSKLEPNYIDDLPQIEKKLEQFCNAVAAEVLIPSADFLHQLTLFPKNIADFTSEEDIEGMCSNLAIRYGVSREVVLRRLSDRGHITADFYSIKVKSWNAQKTKSGGGNWFLNRRSYLSDCFAKEVITRHYRHQITLEQAADFLGVKPKHFAELEELFLEGMST